jgi:hypothetical protein
VSRDVIVDEQLAVAEKPGVEIDMRMEEDAAEAFLPAAQRRVRHVEMEPQSNVLENPHGEIVGVEAAAEDVGGQLENEEQRGVRRNPVRERRKPGEWYRANLASSKDGAYAPDPMTYEEALAGADADLWRKAMDEEMTSLLENGTWELGKLPEGAKALPMKWVYKIKRDAQENVERYKARLVAKGYLQREGIDFEEVYAPMSKHTTLRALLAVVAERDLVLHQLNVKTAFLNGELEEEIYMQQAQGYEEGGPECVCHLKKTLYGLRQAPRAWHTHLKEELEGLEFRASETDPALFVKGMGCDATYILIWVDDILMAEKRMEEIPAVKRLLGEVFDVRDLGEATYFLKMEVNRDRKIGTLKLTQKKLTGELLQRYGMEGARGRDVPMSLGEKVQRDGEPLDREKFPYSELVESLLYLSVCTRPDIAQSVGVLARYMATPVHGNTDRGPLAIGAWGGALPLGDADVWSDLWRKRTGADGVL